MRGIWESSPKTGAVEFSGVLSNGKLTVCHLRAANGNIDLKHLSARDINWVSVEKEPILFFLFHHLISPFSFQLQWGKSGLRSSLGAGGLPVSISAGAHQKVFGNAKLSSTSGVVHVSGLLTYIFETHPSINANLLHLASIVVFTLSDCTQYH